MNNIFLVAKGYSTVEDKGFFESCLQLPQTAQHGVGSSVHPTGCGTHRPSMHIWARAQSVSVCDNLEKICLCAAYGWQCDFTKCILMLASLCLTTAFYCIELLDPQGELLICLPMKLSAQGEQRMNHMSDKAPGRGKTWTHRVKWRKTNGAF